MAKLENRVSIITGGGSGLGKATAERFHTEGARVYVADIDREKGEAVAASVGGTFIHADVTREQDIEHLVASVVAKEGRLDVMINNAAALGAVGGITDITEQAWTRSLPILLGSVFFGMKHAARVMKEQRSGCILSTTSIAGLAPLGPHVYTAAKHGVVGLTRSVASELAEFGIRVNAVAPGTAPTEMTRQVFGGYDGARDASAAKNPLRRAVEPEDIAGGFAYLASDDARNVTGHVLVIDAGLLNLPPSTKHHAQEARYVDARLEA